MKLLIDNQLPEALAAFLSENGLWVRLGNVRRQALLDTFTRLLTDLRSGLESGTSVIEIR